MTKLTVPLNERSYNIIIGPHLIDHAADYLGDILPGNNVVILTDQHVAREWLHPLEQALRMLKKNYHVITIPAGEASKSFTTFQQCCDEALYWGIDRKTCIIALGGGVVGDLAGFMAASLLRGVPFIQIPTSLLAQVDSSIGGKTGINAGPGKNLVGAFWQPKLVLADSSSLATLPERQFKAGLAEVIKYALIDNPTFFDWLLEHADDILAQEQTALHHLVRTSCQAKANIVAADEHEHGVRALLNLGHSFGHVLESFCGYNGSLLHGEAVAIGMQMAFDFSVKLGICTAYDATRVQQMLQLFGLPTHLQMLPQAQTWTDKAFMELLAKDKKAYDNTITLILVKGIGLAYIETNVDITQLQSFIAHALDAKPCS